MGLNKSKEPKDQVSVEDIYIEIEAIFMDCESDYDKRLKTYKVLNEMLPKWEGNKLENNQASFKCKGCEHELPFNYSMKNPEYCYLCDPEVTIDELLK